jgi:alkylation response protein AidB-like acyl-CoA dehydrogenase
LLWAGRAARDVTASAHQVHGAVGFALESGVHRAYRRAKSVEAWTRAVVGAQG